MQEIKSFHCFGQSKSRLLLGSVRTWGASDHHLCLFKELSRIYLMGNGLV